MSDADTQTPAQDIVVIGAGIVGVSTALFLQRDGHRVTIVDPEPPGTKTSFGNAGSISSSSVLPTALPGLLGKLPRMLLDPDGPLNVRWGYLPRLAPFLLDLMRNTSAQRLRANAHAIGSLIHHVIDAYDTLIRQTGTENLVRKNGALKVYENEATFRAAQFERDLLDANDCEYEVLDGDELRQMEPGLQPIFSRAVYMPHSWGAKNPGRLVSEFARHFVNSGGTIVTERAIDFELGERRAVRTDASRIECDIIVLAAGPWSGDLARKLGAPVKLEAERGYHIMLPEPPTTLNRFVTFVDRSFVLTPHEEGLRLTSGIEYAKVDAPPDYRRIRGLLGQAKSVMRDIEPVEQSIWAGNRPTLPDSVPVIGPSPAVDDVYLAFGHSHLGLTLGPVTGRIIADLVATRDPGLDLTPYRANR